MTSAEIKERIRQFLLDTFGFKGLLEGHGDDDSLNEAGIVDSFGVLTLITFLEDEFGVQIADDEVSPDNLDSISRLTSFVERKTRATKA
jgi:acyl carrier protein